MNRELIVNDKMKRMAKANKDIGILQMEPPEFLWMTIRGNVDEWIEKQKQPGAEQPLLSLAMYNEYARRGEIDMMPYLSVDKATGMVLSHEGRHRVASVYVAGGKTVHVSISLRIRGHLEYFDEPFIDEPTNPKRWFRRFFGKKDLPSRFVGQFTHNSVKPDLATWEGFYSDIQTALPVTAGTARPRPVAEILKVSTFVEAATEGWFQVEPIPDAPLTKWHQLNPKLKYWCQRYTTGAYQIFGGTERGPFLEHIKEVDMKANFRSVRLNGKLRVATPQETQIINQNLNWYRGR
jgi:hypothetical protein